MSDGPGDESELGARLRGLRHGWDGITVTQRQLSSALGLSGALLSSWENGTAVPPEDRLNGYARFFATTRSMAGSRPTLLPSEDLTPAEEERRRALVDELVALREAALNESEPRQRDAGQLGGKFWYFPDGQPITILCTPLSRKQLGAAETGDDQFGKLPPSAQYALNRRHPNSVRNLRNGDIDALLELVGHVRAENPTSKVRWRTYDTITSDEQLTGHLVILGGGDAAIDGAQEVTYFSRSLRIPVFVPPLAEEQDQEFGYYFRVSQDADGAATFEGSHGEDYRPRFVRDENDPQRPRVLMSGAPQLESDVAWIVRKPNPLNATAKVTLLSGIFSRGTYGAVRAFTDPLFRARNEQWLANAALKPDDFWMLLRVEVFAGERTMTPDLSKASTRLRISS